MNTNNNVIGVGCDALFGFWLPIETAPKDKIEVLAWSKRHGINVGILTHYKKPEMPSRKGGWFLPTHWMPLPSLPNAKAQATPPAPTNDDHGNK